MIEELEFGRPDRELFWDCDSGIPSAVVVITSRGDNVSSCCKYISHVVCIEF